MAFKQQINIPVVVTVGVISGLVLIVLLLGTQAWYSHEEAAESAAKGAGYQPSEFVVQREQQRADLKSAHWADHTGQTVMIPIDQAMDLIVQSGGKLPSTQPTTQPAAEPTTRPGTEMPAHQ